MLYIRMLVTMAISLYTSRIVISALGVEDFGIYNVVGGFVMLFGILNRAMATATQRFLSFEIGKNDFKELKNVFSMSINIHFLIALSSFILAETIGIWFVNTHLNLPAERMAAARWAFHFAVMTFSVGIITVPYNALIIAHERMKVFAWMSIIDVSLKLFVVFALQWFPNDKLVLYSFLIFFVSLVIRMIYGIYCNRNFPESRFSFYWSKQLFRRLIYFLSWNLWGQMAAVFSGQGVNILLNIFFGPVVNAARGIAYQVRSAAMTFKMNFQTAMNPPIIKSFATNNLDYMHMLLFQSAKFSFYLLLIISIPVLLETEIILRLWLKIVPEYTAIFIRLAIINLLIDSIISPLMTAAQASGKIKLYQVVNGGARILILPVSYFYLKFGYPPEVTFYISIIISLLIFFPLLKITYALVGLSVNDFFHKVILRVIPVAVVSFIPANLIQSAMPESFLRLIILTFTSIVIVIAAIYRIGINQQERLFIQKQIRFIMTKIVDLMSRNRIKFKNSLIIKLTQKDG